MRIVNCIFPSELSVVISTGLGENQLQSLTNGFSVLVNIFLFFHYVVGIGFVCFVLKYS